MAQKRSELFKGTLVTKDSLIMTYLHFKALHIIFVVSWFAGLFYMPRLFVYHTEAKEKPEEEQKILFAQFTKMEKLLWNAIMTPACWLAIIFGSILIYITPAWLHQDWMQLKLLFVAGLLVYHFFTGKILRELREGKFRFSSFQLRLFNEIATIFLFSIVFLVVLKNTVDWLWGVLGLIVFAVLMMTAVRIVKRIRERKNLNSSNFPDK
ncbi:CopD family protein [Dyadobacter sp. NIV53]|uniref:CopD family protein n=1 Tax=Dyadobacter sp. NIV53 TaxID=2861765 RepID=UPI00286EA108|nr:CopD family protein [Dyadobacter sp. NIV53]